MNQLIQWGMHVPRLLLALLVMSCLTNCATSSRTYTKLQPELTPPAEGQGRIFIYRTADSGYNMRPAIKLNDVVVGSAVLGGCIYLDRPPGNYTVSTKTEWNRTVNLTLAPGEVRFVRLSGKDAFLFVIVYPELVDQAVGTAEIRNCHLVKS